MGKVERYTEEMIEAYVGEGYWSRELTVDFWEWRRKRDKKTGSP